MVKFGFCVYTQEEEDDSLSSLSGFDFRILGIFISFRSVEDLIEIARKGSWKNFIDTALTKLVF